MNFPFSGVAMNIKYQKASRPLLVLRSLTLALCLLFIFWASETVQSELPPIDGPQGEHSIGELAKVLKENPKNQIKYRRFIEEAMYQQKYQEAKEILTYLCTRFPDTSQFALDLIEIEFSEGRINEAQESLDRFSEGFDLRHNPHFQLLSAKIFFQQNRDADGESLYRLAASHIQDTLDVFLFIRDIGYLFREDEEAETSGLTPASFPDFLRRFWISRDPDLATPLNERIPEHFRRLFEARNKYRRYTTESYNEDLYAFEHRDKPGVFVQMGDAFKASAVQDSTMWNRDLDDLGLILVRHGHWDDWTTFLCEDCAQNISCRYYKRIDRPEMIFHFVRYGLIRGWCLESLPHYFENRAEFGPKYAQLDPQITAIEASAMELPSLYRELTHLTQTSLKTALTTESPDFQFDVSPLNVPMHFLYFKGDSGRVQMNWYYCLTGREITLRKTGSENLIDITGFMGVFDKTWREQVRQTFHDIRRVRTPESVWVKGHSIDYKQFQVPTGPLFFQAQIQDNVSKRKGVYQGNLNCPFFGENALCMSDVLLSGEIEPQDGPAHFKRAGLKYSPHMFSDYSQGQIIGIYFEPYNLLIDKNGQTRFRVTLTVSSGFPEKKNWFERLFAGKRESISLSHDYLGDKRDDLVFLNFDASRMNSGELTLTVQIEDLLAGTQVEKQVPIRIVAN